MRCGVRSLRWPHHIRVNLHVLHWPSQMQITRSIWPSHVATIHSSRSNWPSQMGRAIYTSRSNWPSQAQMTRSICSRDLIVADFHLPRSRRNSAIVAWRPRGLHQICVIHLRVLRCPGALQIAPRSFIRDHRSCDIFKQTSVSLRLPCKNRAQHSAVCENFLLLHNLRHIGDKEQIRRTGLASGLCLLHIRRHLQTRLACSHSQEAMTTIQGARSQEKSALSSQDPLVPCPYWAHCPVCQLDKIDEGQAVTSSCFFSMKCS